MLAHETVEGIARAIKHMDDKLSMSAKRHYIYEDALLYAYLAMARKDLVWAEHATECLNFAIDEETKRPGAVGLFGGISGLGWTVEHLSRLLPEMDGISLENGAQASVNNDEDLNADTDLALLKEISRSDLPRCYDLLSGLVGVGVYFLERLPRGCSASGLTAVFEAIDRLAERTATGITWRTDPLFLPSRLRAQYPHGYYNLGVAHGVPGIIHFISELSITEVVARSRWEPLLEGAVSWLIGQQRPTKSVSRFDFFFYPGQSSLGGRLAWCYCDLGIAAILLQASQRVARSDWAKFACETLERCLSWSEANGICDATLCHGAAGVAHIFNRIYQCNGERRFRDASIEWFEQVLAMRRDGTGVGGFSTVIDHDPSGRTVDEESAALLDGAGGVALALLAATSDIEPNWDRMLLLSGKGVKAA